MHPDSRSPKGNTMTHTSMPRPFRPDNLLRAALPAVCAAVLGGSACLTDPTEEGESGTRYELTDTATVVRDGVQLIAWYDSLREVFTGTVTNTTDATVRQVRVEIHLSNGTELGPTPRVDLPAGERHAVELDASGQNFDWWSVHIEIGSDSG